MRSAITPKAHLKFKWQKDAMRMAYAGVEVEKAREILKESISTDFKGADTQKRMLGYLNSMWLEPKGEALDLRNKALCLYETSSDDELKSLCFFMLIASYPFLRNVAEVCGRLIRLQGEVKMEQIKRKVAESHGDSEHIIRSTRYAVAIFTDLGVLEVGSQKGMYKAGNSTISNSLSAFCLEAFLRSFDANSQLNREFIETHLSLFSFNSFSLVEQALLSPNFLLSRESVSSEMISLIMKAV